MKTTFIYILIDHITDKIRYVGKPNNPKYRLSAHISESKYTLKRNRRLNWINKLLKLGLVPKLKILDEVPMDGFEFWEAFYIMKFKKFGYDLVNWGDNGQGSTHKKKLNMGHIKKISKTIEQYDLDCKFIKEFISIREAERETGVNHGNISKVCNKIWKHANGYIFKFKHCNKIIVPIIKPNARPNKVIMVNKNGDILNEYNSISDAAKMTGCDAGNISRVCNQKQKKTNNKIFKFKNDENN